MGPLVRTNVERRTLSSAEPRLVVDSLVVEEPLEIRVAGDTLAVTMRTPGHDRELVLGFLWGEGVIRAPSDVSSLAHCTRVGRDDARGNLIEVTLSPGVSLPHDETDAPFARRGTLTTSACGVCGRRSIEDLMSRCAPFRPGARVAGKVITEAVRALRDRQPVFRETGGCHAASLVTMAGETVATFEDVGRHNAVDKVIGSQVRAGAIPLEAHLLVVSGRSSFEIVQKAIAARIAVVVSVSAPSSLAVDLARAANVTLAGFTRGDEFALYAAPGRILH